jgi:hypothetical protein
MHALIVEILGISHVNVPIVDMMVGHKVNMDKMIRPKSQLILLLVSKTRILAMDGIAYGWRAGSTKWNLRIHVEGRLPVII